MKRLMIIAGVILLVAGLLFYLGRPVGLPPERIPQHTADIANGERMFHAGGCASCHQSADSQTKGPLLGGGLEMDTPFGIFRVPNISPDPDTGIGNWTTLEFINAMQLGVSPDDRHYYPAFPYASYSRMRFEDLIDLKAYLDSLPAVQKVSSAHSLGFPFNIRMGLGLWKWANLDPAPVVSVPAGDTKLERGRYLVEGPGHCGECHTPRDWTGGLQSNRWLAGAVNPEGEGKVPNITPSESGLPDWSEGDLAYYLESGFTPDFDTVGNSMVKVQENMARLPAEDREAIAAYLKAVPAVD